MSQSLPFFILFCCLLNLIEGKAQCVQVLTDEPLEVCSSGGTTVNVAIEGDFFEVEWSPNLGLDTANKLNPTFLNPIDTTYLLTLKGLDQQTQDTCITQAFIPIKTVQFDLILPQDTVELPCGDSIRLAAQILPNESFFLIEWETDVGNFVQGNQTLNPLIDAIGNYTLRSLGTLGRIVCEDKDSLTVIYANNILEITPPENLHCNQSAVTLAVVNTDTAASFLYNWTAADGNFVSQTDQAIVVVDEIGAYEVTRTDLFGECSVSQMVTVAAIELEAISLKTIQPTCNIPSGTIIVEEIVGGAMPYSYSIDNGITFQSNREFSTLDRGDYTIIVRDANGCELEHTAQILAFPSFQLDLVTREKVERGTDYLLPLSIETQETGIELIEWQPTHGLSCTDCPNPMLTDFRSTKYTVRVIGNNGCEKEATIEIGITEPNLFFAPSIFSPNGDGQNDEFTIFPNPKIATRLAELAIFDRYGNLVFQKKTTTNNESNSWNGRYRGAAMPNGTYFYLGEIALTNGETERINGTINLVK